MYQRKTIDRDTLFIKALRGRHDVLHLTGKYRAGLEDSKRALSCCRKRISSLALQTELMADLAESLRRNREHEAARQITMNALQHMDRKKHRITYARCMNIMGMLHDDIGDNENTLRFFSESLKINETAGNSDGIASCSNNIGLHYWSKGNLEKALGYFTRALNEWESNNNRVGIGVASGNMGLIHYSKGDLKKALKYFLKNLEVSQEIDHKIRIVIALGNVGEIYKEKGDLVKALTFYQEALTLATEMGNNYEVAFAHLYMGETYCLKGEYREAKQFLEKAERSFRAMNHTINLASASIYLARLHRKENRYQHALKCTREALSLSRKIGAKEQEIAALRELGLILAHTGRAAAISYLKKAISIAKKEMMHLELAKSSFVLGKILEREGRGKDGRKYIDQAITIFRKAGAHGWLKGMDG
jgi:tetratricopeptide (TPR) repeat protein